MARKKSGVVAAVIAVLLVGSGAAGCGEGPQAAPRQSAASESPAGEAPGESSSPAPTSAASPGPHGPIAFRQFAPESAGDPAPLYVVAAGGTEVTLLSDRPGFFSDWRSDGQRIAFDFFEPDGSEQIATARPDGSDVRVLTDGPGIHEVPSWSPNGDRIVYNYSPDDPDSPSFSTRLWTMRADGTDARALPMKSQGFDVEPRYSPDGRRIAFARLRFSAGQQLQSVFVVNTRSRDVRRLTPWSLSAEHPTWSPDGRRVAFSTPEGRIMTVRSNGSGIRTILPASEGAGGHKPFFSPDGSHILFVCQNRGTLPAYPADYNEDLCVMEADGTDIVKVIDSPETFENWPSWPLSSPTPP